MSPREPPRTAGQVGAPTQHTCSAASGLQRDFHAVPSPFFKDARELTHLSAWTFTTRKKQCWESLEKTLLPQSARGAPAPYMACTVGVIPGSFHAFGASRLSLCCPPETLGHPSVTWGAVESRLYCRVL